MISKFQVVYNKSIRSIRPIPRMKIRSVTHAELVGILCKCMKVQNKFEFGIKKKIFVSISSVLSIFQYSESIIVPYCITSCVLLIVQ